MFNLLAAAKGQLGQMQQGQSEGNNNFLEGVLANMSSFMASSRTPHVHGGWKGGWDRDIWKTRLPLLNECFELQAMIRDGE